MRSPYVFEFRINESCKLCYATDLVIEEEEDYNNESGYYGCSNPHSWEIPEIHVEVLAAWEGWSESFAGFVDGIFLQWLELSSIRNSNEKHYADGGGGFS